METKSSPYAFTTHSDGGADRVQGTKIDNEAVIASQAMQLRRLYNF